MQQTLYQMLRTAIRAEHPVALATVVRGDDMGAQTLIRPDMAPLSMLTDTVLVETIQRDAVRMLNDEAQGTVTYGAREVFIETYPPPRYDHHDWCGAYFNRLDGVCSPARLPHRRG
jgi:hypothetical protein